MRDRDGELPWFPWYPGDHLRRTRGWPLIARGIYRELLDAQWDMGRLPADPEALKVLVGATAKEWEAAWPFIEREFERKGEYRQSYHLEYLRGEAQRKHEASRRGAAVTNAKRWGKGAGTKTDDSEPDR